MNRKELVEQIREKQTYLCVGLDTDREKIPAHLDSHHSPLFEFNAAIIDATKDHCVAYKINTAFYEAQGSVGWDALERTVNHIPPTHLVIADAKRGDIGNTSSHYAKAFFETYKFDAVTVAPYMGADSVKPFLAYEDKWTILLALTSNEGSHDFQQLTLHGSEEKLYEKVIRLSSEWGSEEQLMYVVGATRVEDMAAIRKLVPKHFLLIPGVGAQGGSLEEVSRVAMNEEIGILVNVSRGIIYAGGEEDFAEKAAEAAAGYHQQMKLLIQQFK